MSKVYIEKAAFKAMLDKRIYCLCGGETVKETKNIRDLLEAFPPADVKPVMRGEWISMGDFEQCSACKGTHLKKVKTYYGEVIWLKSDFCPNCGAEMRKEEKDE